MQSKKSLFIVSLVLIVFVFTFALSACQKAETTTPTTEVPAVVEETVAEEAVVEEAVVEESVAEETVAEEAVVEEAVTEETAAEEPANLEDKPATLITGPGPVIPEEVKADANVVAVVNGEQVLLDEFVMTAKFVRMQYLNYYYQMATYYSMYGLPLDSANEQFAAMLGEEGKLDLGQSALTQVVYDKCLSFEATAQGIEVTDDQVTEQLKTLFGYAPEETAEDTSMLGLEESTVGVPEVDSDETAKFEAFLDDTLAQDFNNMFTKDFFSKYAKNSLLETALFNKALEGREFNAEMVSARHILVEDEDTAKEIKAKLDSGEDWDTLAKDYSIDESNKDKGGALGWFARGAMVQPFEEAAFAMEPGQISDPVKTDFGYHIIASDGKEVRDLEDEALKTAQDAVYQEWRQELNVKYDFETFDTWQDAVPMEPAFEPIILPTEEPESVEEETTEEITAEVTTDEETDVVTAEEEAAIEDATAGNADDEPMPKATKKK